MHSPLTPEQAARIQRARLAFQAADLRFCLAAEVIARVGGLIAIAALLVAMGALA
jgi:hypothetical protein